MLALYKPFSLTEKQMTMKLNKYGVRGLMEWKAVLKVGQASLHVQFTGGFENEYGSHPATYSTKDPIVQHIIEHSEPYKAGKIFLSESIELGSEETDGAKKADTGSGEETEGVLQQVEVSDWESAKDYLEANFGVKRSNVRYKKDVVQTAKEKGIEFIVKE